MTISLIVSTYNRPDALALVLAGIARQSRLPDEVIVADDGSGASTRELIERTAAGFPVPLRHVWQTDDGFRAGMARNKAIAAASGEYIIQIDGDIVIHRHFIADHAAVARHGAFVVGSRVRLNEKWTQRFCLSGRFPRHIGIFSRAIYKGREKALRLPRRIGSRLSRRYRRGNSAIGCNMAYWRADIIAVNGYDEHFHGWGCEDDDVSRRLAASGLESFKLCRIGLAYHLWHRNEDLSNYGNSRRYYESQAAEGSVRCADGIDKYLR